MNDLKKEFKPASWAIDNRVSIFILTIIITLAGIVAYNNLPKENFPDIVIPQIYVSTVYPGTSPTDIENLVSKPLEKQIKGISGVKKVTSSSVQDFSSVIVEFGTDVNVAIAKQKVKDAVDKARNDLPKDLPRDPNVMEINFSDIPIMFVNISGDMELSRLKKYADDIKDNIESLKEISRIDMAGALEREIQINVDMFKAQAAMATLGDIERAVAYENMTISGGTVSNDGVKRGISIKGEFKDVEVIRNLVVNASGGAAVYLKDIAEVVDGYKEQESFARLGGKNVITLNVVKRSGENLINASEKITDIVNNLKATTLPANLDVVISGDQSTKTRSTLHDLINTIIIGFVLVLIVLMFFMGSTNAFFVALSVPLSMFLAFLIMPAIGFTLNMIVLFAFLLALGIVVDDAIVVIENTHRIFDNGKVPIKIAAKNAAGEVFLPVLAGTLTTLAPFIPLAFWGGVIGKFMFFLPITLIITLLGSLVVAYIINPVFAVQFMKPHEPREAIFNPKFTKQVKLTTVIFVIIGLLFYVTGNFGGGNFVVLIIALYLLHHFQLKKWIYNFQNITWKNIQSKYQSALIWSLGKPRTLMISVVILLFGSVFLVGMRGNNVVFFPSSDPNFVYTYIKLPLGTDQRVTDSVTKIIENKVYKVLGMENGKPNPLVTTVISNVAVGVSDPNQPDFSVTPHKAKISVAFVEFAERDGKNTAVYLDKIREAVKGFPGAEITVEQEQGGPPVGKPINIEVSGDNFTELADASTQLIVFLDSINVLGVEKLKSDFIASKPEIIFNIDRERAARVGISTAQIGMEIRNAVFGKEVSKFREANDEHPIMLRYTYEQRNNAENLKNTKIIFRDMNMGGMLRQVPISTFCDINYTTTLGGINRKNQKRVITVSSNILNGFNPQEVVANVERALKQFPASGNLTVKLTGQQEEQAETASFLGNAMLISLGLIFLILVTQFNSFNKPMIILSEIIFSLIGVFLGYGITGMTISTIMFGIGFVALAGIVVRNGILLVEFTDLLREEGMELKEAIVEAGKTRMAPVVLTATAATLGLIPLAVGLNIDFVKMFTELNPHIFFGGDSVAFWGPLSWTMIFGLTFATFLTLILVPVMYYINEVMLARFARFKEKHF